jgi:putative MATE family efflux protein
MFHIKHCSGRFYIMLILKDKQLRSTILRTALPAMMEMVLYMLIGVVDVAIVGRLGAVPLAAVSLGAEIFFAVVLILEALGIGSAVLVAQAKGAGRMDEASQIAGQTVLLGLLIGTLAGILGVLFAGDIVGLFKVEAAVNAQAVAYLQITFWVVPLALTFYMINTVYRGLGRTDIPMYIALVVNIINCVGNYLLVYGKFGFPQLGVSGAAWATSIAHVVGFLIAAVVLWSGRGQLRVQWYWIKRLRLSIVKQIFSLGIPSFSEQFFNNLSVMVSIYLIVFTGTVSFAAHQVGITVESLSFMPGIGIAIAATALVGQSVGARDKKQLQRVARGTIEMALLFMGCFGLLFALLPYQVAGLFTNDAQIIAIAGLLLRIASMEQLTIALSMVLGGILKGSGDTRTPMLITVLSTWFYRLPLLYLVIHVLHLPVQYAWLVFVSDWLIRSLTYFIVYRRKNWLERAGL